MGIAVEYCEGKSAFCPVSSILVKDNTPYWHLNGERFQDISTNEVLVRFDSVTAYIPREGADLSKEIPFKEMRIWDEDIASAGTVFWDYERSGKDLEPGQTISVMTSNGAILYTEKVQRIVEVCGRRFALCEKEGSLARFYINEMWGAVVDNLAAGYRCLTDVELDEMLSDLDGEEMHMLFRSFEVYGCGVTFKVISIPQHRMTDHILAPSASMPTPKTLYKGSQACLVCLCGFTTPPKVFNRNEVYLSCAVEGSHIRVYNDIKKNLDEYQRPASTH